MSLFLENMIIYKEILSSQQIKYYNYSNKRIWQNYEYKINIQRYNCISILQQELFKWLKRHYLNRKETYMTLEWT